MSASALSFGCCERSGSQPFTERQSRPGGGFGDQRVLCGGPADVRGYVSGVLGFRSSHRGHAVDYIGYGKFGKWLAITDLSGYNKYMTTSQATEALTTAITARTEAVQVAETLTGRRASAAWRAIEELDAEVGFAARRVEQAERAAACAA